MSMVVVAESIGRSLTHKAGGPCDHVSFYSSAAKHFQTRASFIPRRKRILGLDSSNYITASHSNMSSPIYSSYPGIWHVQHSSRELWHGKRNAHAEFTAEGSLDYTYQERETSEIKAYKDTDWKVVVDGKDGYLQCWMKETEYGIEDSAGEIRGDWRARWVVVAFPSGSNTIDGVDILCNRQTEISRDTRMEILGILKLKSKNAQFPGLNDLVLLAVPDDGARNEMRKAAEQGQREWEKRTGKEVGISEDLIYDEVEEEEASRCGVQ